MSQRGRRQQHDDLKRDHVRPRTCGGRRRSENTWRSSLNGTSAHECGLHVSGEDQDVDHGGCEEDPQRDTPRGERKDKEAVTGRGGRN